MKINWDWWPSLLGFLCFRLVLKEKGVRIKWKFVSKSSFFFPKKNFRWNKLKTKHIFISHGNVSFPSATPTPKDLDLLGFFFPFQPHFFPHSGNQVKREKSLFFKRPDPPRSSPSPDQSIKHPLRS